MTTPQTDPRPAVTPRVDIYENEQEILFVAELPGVAEKDLELSAEQGSLVLQADTEPLEVTGRLLAREIPDVRYRCVFELPRGMDVDAVRAELADGVLKVHVPRAPRAEPRRIQVQTVQ